ncbi:MAG: IS1096 element passenger TnpR family protein [Chitinophagales bacterium]
MAIIYRFRVQLEDDEFNVYRDIDVKSSQNLYDLHLGILEAYEFDQLYEAELYLTDDGWVKQERFSLIDDSVELFKDTALKDIVYDPRQKFIYYYDPEKCWTFYIKMHQILTCRDALKRYAHCANVYGIAPSQYTPAELEQKKQLLDKQYLNIRSSLR